MFGCALRAMLFGLIWLPCFAIADPVRIDLLGRLEISAKVASVSDLARVSGGDLIIRRKIAALDIASLDVANPTKRVTKRQVHLRILLAGVRNEDFRVVGAESITLKLAKSHSPETRVLELLRPAIAERMGVAERDLKLQLNKPIPARADPFFDTRNTLEHTLRNEVRAGIFTTQIRIRKDERLIQTLSVSLDVQVFQNIYVARRQVEMGTVLSENDVTLERRLVSGREKTMSASVIGKKTRKTLQAGDVLSDRNLDRPAPAKPEIVIRSRDIVEVVARSASLQARISGAIALQRGAPGDSIRVKNPRSGRVLTAKVVSAGLVEIRL